RVYKTSLTSKSVIAVAVDDDGFEISDINSEDPNAVYVSVNGNEAFVGEPTPLLRFGASLVLRPPVGGGQASFKVFTAFFFSEDLERIMEGHDGVAFYSLQLSQVEAGRIPDHITDRMGGARNIDFDTLIGVGTNVMDDQLLHPSLDAGVNTVISTVPCPGQCTSFDAINGQVVADGARYLNPRAWF
ncbi:MAG: hypothetical protein AAF597_08165, partial [Bacteroidota bacterium]